ncbi:amino acid adenylation domain-containing protein [Nocardia lijiangensis]|uniref:amino acid adenylation domain-containing protein n=1 Tax=Nocardia lijiangensis TaxID=299618 RepID=UPI003D7231A4
MTSLWRLFTATARQFHRRTALRDSKRSYTYAELADACGRLAAVLRTRGIGDSEPVLVCADRGADAVVATLAIVAAGGTPTPVEPHSPATRFALIARTCGARHAVVDDAGAAAMCTGDVAVTHVGERAPDPSREESTAPSRLAYVLFTSGSTGVPKGVEVTQHGLLALLSGAAQWDSSGPADVWAGFHSFSFDVSMWEMWRSLTVGAELVVLPRRAQVDAGHAWSLLDRYEISVLCQTPTAVRMLGNQVEARGIPPRLRRLLIAGERLDFGSLRPFAAAVATGGLEIWNLYGPTEATVYSAGHRVTAHDLDHERRSVIGRALPHVRLRVPERADDGIGELWISGAGLAAGYCGDPALTQDRFVGADTAERSYRTGDLVRDIGGGAYEFIARSGGFLKVRGYRVEPGEIVHAVCAHPAVSQAAVAVSDVLGFGDTIVCTVVPRTGCSVTDLQLRRHIAQLLPDYMRPGRIVFVERLPQLPSGKLDQRALQVLVDDRLHNQVR